MLQVCKQHVSRWGLVMIALLSSLLLAPVAHAQEAETAAAATEGGPDSFLQILNSGGVIGYLIILLSLAAAARAIEYLIALRKDVLIPPGLADEVRGLLDRGQVARADEQCKLRPSLLSYVLRAGFQELDGGWPAVEKGMEDALAEQSARLYRKIEFLSVVGNIAPMLGLLGTVVGMVLAFREVAISSGTARAAELAQGIYLALVTTVMGLTVAIPSLMAFALFRNRVDQLTAEATNVAQYAFGPVKRRRRGAAGTPPATGGATPSSTPPRPPEAN